MSQSLQHIGGILFIMAFGFILLLRSGKSKEGLRHATGHVTYFSKSLAGNPDRHDGDSTMRYLRISSHPQAFAFFIGKAPGDFKPAFEQLDEIRLGDTLTVYFASPLPFQAHNNPAINNDCQFLDKNHTPYYIRGDSKDRWGAYFFLAIGGILLLVLAFLKH